MSTTVNISELKNRLSHYLRLVRQGETIVVRDRDRVVARIEPAGAPAAEADDEAALAELERTGAVRRGTGRLPEGWGERRVHVAADVVGAVLAEREDGR